MNYGRYRHVRNAAWQCLLDFRIDRLPVRLKPITEQCGIKVIADRYVHALRAQDYGKAMAIKGQWYIVVDDARPLCEYRYTIAHELGHIFLGHVTTAGCSDFAAQYRYFDQKPPIEIQADAFAARLLCPAAVLRAMDITTTEGIMATCHVPRDCAMERARRIAVLESRRPTPYLTHPLEQQVLARFQAYIHRSL